MQKIRPFLWFDACAEEAIAFYVSIFPGAKAIDERRFEIAGQQFIAFDGGPHFEFTPAISFFVSCADQAEIDRLWAALLEGGKPSRCGWITDRFGVTWQIVPERLGDLLDDPDETRAERVREAMLGMVKLNIAELEAAHAAAG